MKVCTKKSKWNCVQTNDLNESVYKQMILNESVYKQKILNESVYK